MTVMDWDDKVVLVSDDPEPLDEGEYPFEIESFNHAMVRNGKNADKPQADYIFKVSNAEGRTKRLHYRIVLDTDYMWKMAGFFKAVGMVPDNLPDGTEFDADWNGAVGKSGMCELRIREYLKDDNTTSKTNDIVRIWKAQAPVQQAPVQQAPVQQAAPLYSDVPF